MRAILWDLDGTIVDTHEQHFQAWRLSFAKQGMDHNYAEFLRNFGRTNAEIIPQFLPHLSPPEVDHFSRQKEAFFRQLLADTQNLAPLPGIQRWIEAFFQAGIPQVVASSGPMANIVASVSALGLSDYFHCLVSGSRLPKGKPDPQIFLNAAASLGAQPRECIVFEDSVAGIEAARRAGMSSIVVGSLAASEKLGALLARVAGRSCLALGDVEKLNWEQIEALW